MCSDLYSDCRLICSDGELLLNSLVIDMLYPHLPASAGMAGKTLILPGHTVSQIKADVYLAFNLEVGRKKMTVGVKSDIT